MYLGITAQSSWHIKLIITPPKFMYIFIILYVTFPGMISGVDSKFFSTLWLKIDKLKLT